MRIELLTTEKGTAVYLTQFDRGNAYITQISPIVKGDHAAALRMLDRAESLYDAGYLGSEIFRKLSS